MSNPSPPATDEPALDSLLQEVHDAYGYDFRDYARAHLKRRLLRFMAQKALPDLESLRRHLPVNRALFAGLLSDLTVHTTELFRDSEFYRATRLQVLPWLRTFSSFKIWHAGCSSGEEVFSLAILLHEEGLLDRARIYATDLSPLAIDQARAGIFRLQDMRQYTRNYQQAGGRASLADYYSARYDGAVMDRQLTRNVVFSTHNLATDASFGEMHLIVCRNVLIYFNRTLQDRVLGLFLESLRHSGMLALGSRETTRFSKHVARFQDIDPEQRIYRKEGS
jgi:chemotaxis protein methyltransferase CheR